MFKKWIPIFVLIIFLLSFVNELLGLFFFVLLSRPPFLIFGFLFPHAINDLSINDVNSNYYYLFNSPFFVFFMTLLFWFAVGVLIDLILLKVSKLLKLKNTKV